MKRSLHIFATLLCLLALLLPVAAFCLQSTQTTQSSCDHCSPRHSVPACCTAQHPQPAAIVTSTDRPQLSQIALSLTPAFRDELFHQPLSVYELEAPPPLPRLTALRI
ncbi:MAG: hypothetical protein WDN23_00705 [Edaphobacter sp.]